MVAHVLHEGKYKTTMKLWICEYLASQYESLVNVIRRLYIWKSSFVNVMFANIEYVLRNLCAMEFTSSELKNLITRNTILNMLTGVYLEHVYMEYTFKTVHMEYISNMFARSTFMNMFTQCTFINMFTEPKFSNKQCIRKMRFTFEVNGVQNDMDKLRTCPY